MPAHSITGRVVFNHSTHVEGLIPVLKKLAKYEGVGTITPGVLRRMRSRPAPFSLKVSVAIQGGFKLRAKKGTTVQEVFVVTTLDQVGLEAAIAQVLGKKAR